MKFVTFDFETAQPRHDPCEIGITVVENFEIQDCFSWFIKPICFPDFSPHCQKIHNIKPEDVANTLNFGELWPKIEHYFQNRLVFAHKVDFDLDVLGKTLEYYSIDFFDKPNFTSFSQGMSVGLQVDVPIERFYCSYEIARQLFDFLPNHTLDTVCRLLGIEFNHHGAGPDSLATAQMLIRIFQSIGITTIQECLRFFDEPDEWLRSIKTKTTKRKKANTQQENNGGYPPETRRKAGYNEKYVSKKVKTGEQIVYNGDIPNPRSPFFGKLIAMSGFSEERETNLAEIVELIGGTYKEKTVTKKTDILLVSDEYWENQENPSGKMKKAMEYAERGLPITMISEADFLKDVPHEITEQELIES